MSIGIRVTFGALARHAQGAMETAMGRVARAQDTLTTGRRVTRPSDDPGAAAQIIGLKNALGDMDQYLRNVGTARNFLQVSDATLDGVGSLIRQARNITLQAATSTSDTPEARQALAAQIAGIKEQLVGLAGTNVNGRYIFGGQRTDVRPYDPADPTNTYAGDSGQLRVQINRGEYVAMNVPGDQLFSPLLDDLDTLRSDILAGNLTALSTSGITTITDGLNRVLSARGTLGAQVSRMEETRGRLEGARQEFAVMTSNLEDMDIAQAIVQLQAAQNAYQASLASTARTFERSLMDYLR